MDIQRRHFLRGRLSARHTGLFPPWIREDINFHNQCTQCGECIAACSEGILIKNEDGFPQVDFKKGGCVFCGDCARACAHDVFKQDLDSKPWQQVANIEIDCLTYKGVACQSCQDSCDSHAIRFEYAVGWTPRPAVNTDTCNGCGMCVQVCPAEAINVMPVQTKGQKSYAQSA